MKIELDCNEQPCCFPLCGCAKARAYDKQIELNNQEE